MKPSAPPRELSVSDIAGAMHACRANALELIEEAHILFDAGRQARAYTLVHSACEELAKFFILDIAGRRVAQCNPPDWKRFWQRLRNHDSKIAQADVRLRLALEAAKETDGLPLAGLELLSSYGLVPRNSSLYTDLGPEGAFRKPSDIDWEPGFAALRATAQSLLNAARGLGLSSGAIESSFREVKIDDQERTLATFVYVVERLRSLGIDQEKLEERLSRLWGRGRKV